MIRLLTIAMIVADCAGSASAQFSGKDDRLEPCTDTTVSFEKRIKGCDKAIAALSVDTNINQRFTGWALLFRSDAYASLGKYDEAIADADKSHDLFPDERHILGAQCWVRAASNREIDKARQACDASMAINPDDPAIMDSVGMVALRQERWADAAKIYGKAYSYDSSMIGSLYGIALAAYAQGKTNSGDTILKTVKAKKPAVIDEYKGYGLTFEGMKAKAPKAN